ncbi:3-deoxy-D-manno-octulosonic acid transferase [Segetibacter sp. 3557_3]|uniref:3-deoxy-D-manno-octulosonic acid transferase n=1 Tax=Segetibacter sp. 3557_3 TaxID=2547429 RepID=UPI001FB69534|nr:glycosyltransferase N-terminal domain-containing protein [Segetibacter sp. 3557_3]
MSRLLYNFFIRLYPLIIRFLSPFNPKARQWRRGRKDLFTLLNNRVAPTDNTIWMHCASLGEFEQGRPLLEKLKSENEGYKIVLTFFSPSGFEVRKDYEGADVICYLPMDSRGNAKRFFDLVHPSLILFVKYEFWYYYLAEAYKRKVPLLLVSGVFREDQPFFRWYGGLHRKMLKAFTHFFIQNADSAELLELLGFKDNVTVSGDTRFDRVLQIAATVRDIPQISSFCNGAEVVVAGSTWGEDDEEMAHFVNSGAAIKFIIAPHDIGKDRLNECSRLYKKSMLYSAFIAADGKAGENINTLIIDNIGMLSSLYQYATVAYVGGGFGDDGVHNVLEAAVYGKPVLFGPVYQKFVEAGELVACGGAFPVKNALELEKLLTKLLARDHQYILASHAAANYVMGKKGPTEAIAAYIYENRLLTS